VAAWSTPLEPAPRWQPPVVRADDPRLGDVIEPWTGDVRALRPGRAVLVGFPQDEGVARNHGRAGAAAAPNAIRERLYRLTPWDGENDVDLAEIPPLDLGNLHLNGTLEATQAALGEVIAAILQSGAIPVVLGGGHETAFGHFLGYAALNRRVGIINVDAHLDVRPALSGQGHSGSPFRQALEHPSKVLAGQHYACLGLQPHAVSRAHWLYAREKGCVVRWCEQVRDKLPAQLAVERDRLANAGCQVYVSIDADAVSATEVPGVSAPNTLGFAGAAVAACARLAGQSPAVASLDLVEINPRLDIDNRSASWAALAIWSFLVGVALRPVAPSGPSIAGS